MGAYVRWWSDALLVVAAAAVSPGAGHTSNHDKPVERYATRQGNVIQLHPSEVTLEVPEAWRGAKTWFRLTRQELRKASREGWGLQIAEGTLELRDCAAQIQPDNLRWLRAYVVDQSEEEILKRIREKGWRAAEKMPNYVRGHSGFQTVPAKEGPWVHVDIPYTLDFGDYNGQGYTSFYLQVVGGRELVIVIGYFAAGPGPTDERQNVLKSVVVPDAAT